MSEESHRGALVGRATQERPKKVRARNLSKAGQRAGAATERVVASMAEPNRSALRQYLSAERASGVKASRIRNTALALSYLHAEAAGTPFADIRPEALTSIMERHTARHSPPTTSKSAGTVRAY